MFLALLKNLSICLQFTSSEPYIRRIAVQTVRITFTMFPLGQELRTTVLFSLEIIKKKKGKTPIMIYQALTFKFIYLFILSQGLSLHVQREASMC